LIETIRGFVTTHRNSPELQVLRPLLDQAKGALEARHALVHTSWLLFDFVDPKNVSIGGRRSLPRRRRNQEGEVTQFIDGSIEEALKNSGTLEELRAQFLEWARKYNATHSIYPRQRDFSQP
jgi:hypothetical protein